MREIMSALILAFCVLTSTLLQYGPFAATVESGQKKRLWICYVALFAVNLAVLIGMMFLWGVEGAFMYLRFGMIVYAALQTLINILVISGKTREHLFVFGVVVTGNYLLMSVPNYLITFLPGYSSSVYLFVVLTVYSGLLLLNYWPMRRLLRRTVEPFLDLDTGEYWNTIWFIPIAILGTRFLFVGGEHNSGGIAQLLSSALSGAVIILICLSVSSDHVHMRARHAMEKQLEDQKIHYKQLQTRVEDTRKTKHDLKHHMAAILHLVELDDKEGVRSYCDELLDRVEARERIPYTGNTAVDGVLYYYMQRAAEKQIDLQCIGTIHSHGIADMDLCVLLGNGLDNALAGCLTVSEGRSIRVISQSGERMLSVMICNSFDGKVEQGKEGLLSRKRENAYGVGLQSMQSVCAHYGGSFEVKWDEQTFTIMFILPLSE